MSPMRVVINAFFAAAAALGRSIQKPMSKYEASPTSSQNMKSSSKLLAITTPSIAPEKNDRHAKKRQKSLSSAMKPTLKTKIHRPTSEIITSTAAASGSRTNPSRNVWSPNVNHVKFWTSRKPDVCNVGTNATIEIASTTIWLPIASAAALLRHELD